MISHMRDARGQFSLELSHVSLSLITQFKTENSNRTIQDTEQFHLNRAKTESNFSL